MKEIDGKKVCVITFGSENIGSYAKGAERLGNSLIEQGFKGEFIYIDDENKISCPSHKDVQYAFKPYCFMYAKEKGYDIVIWCDCSLWVIKPIDTVVEYINKTGYLLFLNGWKSGEWCCDSALPALGKTREETFSYRHLLACCMGFDFTNDLSNEFLRKWYDYAKEGTAFIGPHTNEERQASSDKRVLGHRHDQTVASIVATDLGMDKWVEGKIQYLLEDTVINDNTVFLAQGM